MLIAIDTSTSMASLALVEEGRLLGELTWHCGQDHTAQLLPSLAFLLAKVKMGIKTASGVVVARGPGSFNGLRVGIGTAKGLAYSLSIPVVGVSTLETEAYPHAETGLPICPIQNAGRGEIATALYRKQRGRWRRVTPEYITTLDKLLAGINRRTLFCGEYIPVVETAIKEKLGAKALIVPPAARLRRASFLAELGRRRIEAGDFDNLATLQPLYLRRPPITSPRPRHTLEGSKT